MKLWGDPPSDIYKYILGSHVAELLLTLGERAQKSVFRCRITAQKCDRLIVNRFLNKFTAGNAFVE